MIDLCNVTVTCPDGEDHVAVWADRRPNQLSAGSGSASPSLAVSCTAPRCCSSTIRPAPGTTSAAPRSCASSPA